MHSKALESINSKTPRHTKTQNTHVSLFNWTFKYINEKAPLKTDQAIPMKLTLIDLPKFPLAKK